MFKLGVLVILHLMLAQALAEPNLRQRMQAANNRVGFARQNPYIVLSLSRGRSNALVQGNDQSVNDAADSYINDRELVHADDEDDDEGQDDDDYVSSDDEPVLLGARHTINVNGADQMYDEDDDNDDNSDAPVRPNQMHNIIKNAKSTHMMVAREHTGAIMVPDGVIEIEGQSIIDEKTGKSTLLVPRAALDAIPDGSVVALMEPSTGDTLVGHEEEERANRVIVRRRRKGGRRNVRTQRRGGNRRNRRGGANRRRRVSNKRTNVRVVQGNRRRNNRRRVGSAVRPILVQG